MLLTLIVYDLQSQLSDFSINWIRRAGALRLWMVFVWIPLDSVTIYYRSCGISSSPSHSFREIFWTQVHDLIYLDDWFAFQQKHFSSTCERDLILFDMLKTIIAFHSMNNLNNYLFRFFCYLMKCLNSIWSPNCYFMTIMYKPN